MWRSANAVISGLVIAAGAVTVLAVLGISLALAAGQFEDETRLMLRLLRLMFPYMLLVCLAAVFIGMANARGHFFVPALGAVVAQRHHDRQRAAAGAAHGPRAGAANLRPGHRRGGGGPGPGLLPVAEPLPRGLPLRVGFALARPHRPRGRPQDAARLDRRRRLPDQRAGHAVLLVLVRPDHRRHLQLLRAADGTAARHVRHLAGHLPAADARRPGGRQEAPRVPPDPQPGLELPGLREPDRRGHRPGAGGADRAAHLRARQIRPRRHPARGAVAGLPGAGTADVLDEQHPGARLLRAE